MAVAALQGSEDISGGSAKSAASCQTCYATLKKEYQQVKQLWELSEFGWDDAKLVVTAEDDMWNRYIEAYPDFKKWRKNLFPLYREMADLVEGTYTMEKDSGNDSPPIAPIVGDIGSTIMAPDSPAPTPAPSALLLTPSGDLSTSRSGKRTRNSNHKSGSMVIDGMASSISRLAEAMSSDAGILSPEQKRLTNHAIENDGDLRALHFPWFPGRFYMESM
ncbi:hypothetical protein H0H92_011271 [Tricholoma furcatifolium]|nr:hypothetical protein H0H92_011271 [Tricholoma furcatifolium]